jgi:hypothetical protein
MRAKGPALRLCTPIYMQLGVYLYGNANHLGYAVQTGINTGRHDRLAVHRRDMQMRKQLVLLATVLALSTVVFAQQQDTPEPPKGEFFAGYSYMRSNLDNDSLGTAGLNGINLQATAYFHENLGITADVTRGSGSNVEESGVDVHRWTYLFGPTYSLHTSSQVTPFVHVLFGLDHERFSSQPAPDYITHSFAADFGGGLDVKLADRVALRLAELDYIHTDHTSGENAFRYSAGIVFGF